MLYIVHIRQQNNTLLRNLPRIISIINPVILERTVIGDKYHFHCHNAYYQRHTFSVFSRKSTYASNTQTRQRNKIVHNRIRIPNEPAALQTHDKYHRGRQE